MAYQGGSLVGAPQTKENSITNAIADLDPCLERAERHAGELRNLCERLRGPRPAEVMNKQYQDVQQPLIGSIHERRSRLVAILDDIDRSVQELNSAI